MYTCMHTCMHVCMCEHLTIVGGLGLAVLEEAQHGEGLHLVLHAQVAVGHAVHLHHADRQLLALRLR